MRLDNFDLNLLIAFDILVEERSVTRAAKRLNLTQSATSAALKRLREAMQDEILVQHRKRMIPTPHALHLAPHVNGMITQLRNLLSASAAFDPRTSTRRFTVEASTTSPRCCSSRFCRFSLARRPECASTSLSRRRGAAKD